MKKISLLLAVLMIITFITPPRSQALNFPGPNISSESALVVSIDNDLIVHEKNADMRQMPGSLANIMTAIVCLENLNDLKQEVTVNSSVYADLEYSEYPEDLRYANIKNGDRLTVGDLLYAMMLTSSVEASMTIADLVGNGNIDKFVTMMNETAQKIGCTSTQFTNPTGLYDEGQYTTARDMCYITKYALKNHSIIKTISETFSYNPSVPNFDRHPKHSEWIWEHSNIMMDNNSTYYYAGAKGIKTGNLSAAGRNIVTMASRDGFTYLIVLLKAPIRLEEKDSKFYHIDDATILLNWAFSQFAYRTILSETEESGECPVSLAVGGEYVLVRPKAEVSSLWFKGVETSMIEKKIQLYTNVKAPVQKGDKLGEVTLKYAGAEIATVDLVAMSNVERSLTKYNLFALKKFPDSEWFSKAITISVILCALYILLCIYSFTVFKNGKKPVKPIYAVPKAPKEEKIRARKDGNSE